jgi:integrase
VKFKDGVGRWRMQVVAARTKTEARRLADELERKAERQRLGLEALPSDSSMTVAELARWWLDNRCPPTSKDKEEARLQLDVISKPIGELRLGFVTTEKLEELLEGKKRGGAEPATLNRLRATLHTMFARARKAKLFTGTNPVTDVEVRPVAKRVYHTLRAQEVPLLLAHVDDEWRDFFAAAIWTGLRKGELCGLLKSDVDLPARRLLVARSYDNDTTKGRHADVIPIAEPLVPFLENAMDRSSTQWVFPAPDGSMRTDEADPQKILRTALAHAGLVDGYETGTITSAGAASRAG